MSVRLFLTFDLSYGPIDEENPEAGLKEKLAHLGEVTVELQRCRYISNFENQDQDRPFHAAVQSAIPEKATKVRYDPADQPLIAPIHDS